MGRGMPHAPDLPLLGTAASGARGATPTPSPVSGLHVLPVHISQPSTCWAWHGAVLGVDGEAEPPEVHWGLSRARECVAGNRAAL